MNMLLIFMLTSYIVNISNSQRKIKDGQKITTAKKFMVYFLEAEQSSRQYNAWICGGAIVSSSFIVTSAACVEDVEYMYAIAGGSRYATLEDIDSNECAIKKKVVFTCVPKAYTMSYDNIEKWSYIDIAAVKVESPYDFDTGPCDLNPAWTPEKIKINYNAKYQTPGTDALVLGWGHTSHWRQVDDKKNYNQEYLQYAPTLIQDKTNCKKYYSKLPKLQATIDKYMICTFKEGNIDDSGEEIVTQKPDAEGCSDEDKKAGRCESKSLRENIKNQDFLETPPPPKPIPSVYDFDDVSIDLRRAIQNDTYIIRRNGICQNDHGGPLITWVGSHHVLIGVASVFRISNKSECVGPYLYTSTQCNGLFLDCVINKYDPDEPNVLSTGDNKSSPSPKEKDICDKAPAERGFEIVQRRISWKHHPDGPAKNELEELFERPQIPLHDLNKHSKSAKLPTKTSKSGSGQRAAETMISAKPKS